MKPNSKGPRAKVSIMHNTFFTTGFKVFFSLSLFHTDQNSILNTSNTVLISVKRNETKSSIYHSLLKSTVKSYLHDYFSGRTKNAMLKMSSQLSILTGNTLLPTFL